MTDVVVWGGSVSPYYQVTDLATQANISGFPALAGAVSSVAIAPDGSKIAFVHQNTPFFSVVDVATKTLETGWPTLPTGGGDAVCWSPDSSRIGVSWGFSGGTPYYWVIDVASKTAESGWPALARETAGPRALQFSPDGTRLGAGHETGNRLTVITVATKTAETGWPTLASSGRSLDWSQDSARLAVATSASPRLYVINTSTKAAETGWPSPAATGSGRAVSFNDDRTKLAFGHEQSPPSYYVFDTTAKTADAGWPTLTGGGIDTVFSPDGAKLAVATPLTAGRIYDVATKTAISGYTSTVGSVNVFAFGTFPTTSLGLVVGYMSLR